MTILETIADMRLYLTDGLAASRGSLLTWIAALEQMSFTFDKWYNSTDPNNRFHSRSELNDCWVEAIRSAEAQTQAKNAMVPFVIVEKFADNGAHSHWAVVERSTGKVLYEQH
jgi:hypothetical protein